MENKKQELLEIIPFKCGRLPMKYLRVPLLAKRLGINDCKDMIDNVANRINSCRNKLLSYAGRIQLIASVLSTMQNYWASIYMLPATIVKDLEKMFKKFLWNSGDSDRLKAKVAWNLVYRPKEKVGNGRDILVWHDKWCSLSPLNRLFANRDLYDERLDDDSKIVDMVKDMDVWVGRDNKEVKFSTKTSLYLVAGNSWKAYDSGQNHEMDSSCIIDDVENKLKTLIVKETPAVLVVAKEWQLS
ncbi:hypothetical protein Tco_1234143 [Tanacetum coccineum]